MTCGECAAQIGLWLDYRAPFRGYTTIAYTPERNASLTQSEYSARAKDRAALIRGQVEGIRASCLRSGHAR